MTLLEAARADAEEVFANWVKALGEAVEREDADSAAALVDADGYWKDVLAFTWGYRTFSGREEIARGLRQTFAATQARNFRPSSTRTPPRRVRRSAMPLIEAYFEFDTAFGTADGFVRLHDDGTSLPSAWIMLTSLHSLTGFEERIGERRPERAGTSGKPGENWADWRRREQEFADRDPEVLVVGGGQSGLMIAARLRQMDVDTLVVDKHERVGDNWRERYSSLTLHNETWANSLPYLPFPETWPTYLPKDKLAGWLEAYAEFMELNVWTGTEFLGAERNASDTAWCARLRRPDGSIREVTTPHLVLATGGHSGIPHRPDIPGLDSFRGSVLHSSEFPGGSQYRGQRVVVFGTGSSGHDIAKDLHENGAAQVTMIQRNPTCVVSLNPSAIMIYAIYSEGVPPEDVDLITAAIPYPVLKETYQWLTARTCEYDKELLDGLEARGFRTDFEPDRTGFHMRYLRKGGGYYINTGCSELIINGSIGVKQAEDIEQVVPEGLRLRDGSVLEADSIVLATGYKNQQEGIRSLLGDAIAERVGPVWGFDENGNMRNMWQRTAQKGLWIMGGALMEGRFYSRPLALQIKAELEGIYPPAAKTAG